MHTHSRKESNDSAIAAASYHGNVVSCIRNARPYLCPLATFCVRHECSPCQMTRVPEFVNIFNPTKKKKKKKEGGGDSLKRLGFKMDQGEFNNINMDM